MKETTLLPEGAPAGEIAGYMEQDIGRNDGIPPRDAWHVYLLLCADDSLYCGITRDLARRLAQHNGIVGGGARYTRGRRPVRLAGSILCDCKSGALRLEALIKSLPRRKKLEIFRGEAAKNAKF